MNDEQPDGLRRALLALLPMLAIAEDSSAQDAVQSQPQNFRVAFENDKVRVISHNFSPNDASTREITVSYVTYN